MSRLPPNATQEQLIKRAEELAYHAATADKGEVLARKNSQELGYKTVGLMHATKEAGESSSAFFDSLIGLEAQAQLNVLYKAWSITPVENSMLAANTEMRMAQLLRPGSELKLPDHGGCPAELLPNCIKEFKRQRDLRHRFDYQGRGADAPPGKHYGGMTPGTAPPDGVKPGAQAPVARTAPPAQRPRAFAPG